MIKYYMRNRIFKRQASRMLVFAMLFSMIVGMWMGTFLPVQAAETSWAKFSELSSLTEENGVLTNNTGNVTLSDRYYIVDKDTTITGLDATEERVANSAIVISGTVELFIPKGITLTVKGGDAYNEKAGAAGIELTSGNKLYLFGEGKLIATGGNAGNGSDGKVGGNGGNSSRTVSLSTGTNVNFNNALCWGDSLCAGAGGAGGNGGGGAGAGIGTPGGAGGAGAPSTGNLAHKFMTYNSSMTGNATDLAWGDLRSKTAKKGTSGGTGQDGATFGEIYKDSLITIVATGGSAGTLGGAAGDYGKSLFMRAEISSYVYYVGCYGGGGGAGGGAGFSAYGIGTGGTGGNGGSAGGSGNIDVGIKDVISWGSGCRNANLASHARTYGAYGVGGAGGKGSVNGAAGSYISYNFTSCTCTGGAWSKVGANGGTALDAANKSVEKMALAYTPDNLGYNVEDDDSNYNAEQLNNLADSHGDLFKKVTGNSLTDNDVNSNLRVELARENQALVAYKIADVTWDDVISGYTYPAWVSAVEEWINADARSSDFKKNLLAYASPKTLASASNDLQDAIFRDIVADTTLLNSLEAFDEPIYSSVAVNEDENNQEEQEGQEGQEEQEDQEDSLTTKHYALFENLTFGTYLIAASGYSPVVINIVPERSASGYIVPLLFETSLKGGGVDVTKKINGHDVDTVAVGDTVNFEISFMKPSNTTAESVIVLTDIMSKAFLLKDVNSIVISADQAGTQILISDTDYSIGATSTNEDGSTNIPITFVANKLNAISTERLYVRYSAIVTKDVKYNSEENYNTAILQVDLLKNEDTVRAYTYGLNVIKRDGSSANEVEDMDYLPNAEFHLFKEKYIYINDEYVGSFDEKAGMNYTKMSVEAPADNFVEMCLANPTQYYVHEYDAEEAGFIMVDGETVDYVKDASIIRIYELVTNGAGFSDNEGTIKSVKSEDGVTIGGLDAGNYILSETQAPLGYRLLAEDIYFEINRLTEDEAKMKTSGSLSAFYELGEDTQLNESGKVKIDVLNYRGLTLPSTGGMGTMLFTIIGIAVMAGAIMIIIKKRNKITY